MLTGKHSNATARCDTAQLNRESDDVEIRVALSLPRDAASVPVSRQVLNSCLETLGVTSGTREDIALALTEACANVILHAGPGADYEVTARTRGGRCIIEVRDTSDKARLLPPPRTPVSVFDEHGRGLQIIDAVVDDLSLSGSDGNGTTLHFEKNLDWVPGAAAEHLFLPDPD
jgi:serine/threonine-protein kinase RsbW